MKINWVDILIVIYIVMSVLWGKKRGLSEEIITFIVALFSWIIALHFYNNVGQLINDWFLMSLSASKAIAFIALVCGIFAIGSFFGKLLKNVMKFKFTPNIEGIGGLIIGGLRGGVIVSIIIVSLVLIPKDFLKREFYSNSLLGNYLVSLNTKIYNLIWPKKNLCSEVSAVNSYKYFA